MTDRRCAVCASTEIIAVAPGDAPERAADLFPVSHGVPERAWCAGCWLLQKEAKDV